jgi:hypothetical protein
MGTQDAVDRADWEHVADLELAGNAVAFCDNSVLGELFRLHRQDFVESGSPPGIGGSVVMERVDTAARHPLEVSSDGDGLVIAARVCFVGAGESLDESAGEWRRTGELHLSKGQCLVGDPFATGTARRRVIQVAPGRYVSERFETPVTGVEGAGDDDEAGPPPVVGGMRIFFYGRRPPDVLRSR